MAKKQQQTFDITARITADVTIGVNADNLADAVEATKGLKYVDFITVDGELFDVDMEIKGVWKS